MRILHFIPSLDPARGGPIRAVSDLAQALRTRGHAVTLLTTELPPPDRAKDIDPSAVALPGPLRISLPFSRAQLRKARDILAHHDALHTHGAWHWCNAQLGTAARAMGKPYVVSPRGMLDDWCMQQLAFKKRLYWNLLGRTHFERAAAVHCTAQGELSQSKKWFPRGTGVVISNFLDLAPYRNLPGPDQARAAFPALKTPAHKVLFLSRIDPKKGLDVFLRAAAILKQHGTPALYVIAGKREGAYGVAMENLATSLGLGDAVLWTGHVGGSMKLSLYQACNLMAIPTSQENFGFIFPECLGCGTPVITTKGVDIWPELLQSGSVEIVDRTPQAFADAIARLLQDPARREWMAKRAGPFVLSHFDDTRILREFEELYQRCIDSHAPKNT
jgi:glycosyltransferase involved in cell wall biosynthesis